MTRKCIVPKCKSGYESNKERVSLFHVPKDEELQRQWINAIPKTTVPLKPTHLVCEKHFREVDIIRHFIHKNADGNIIAKVPYKCPRLVDGSVPSIFSGIDVHSDIDHEKGHSDTETQISEQHLVLSTAIVPPVPPDTNLHLQQVTDDDKQTAERTDTGEIKDHDKTISTNETPELSESESNRTLKELFPKILENSEFINIPKNWVRYTCSTGRKWIAFSSFDIKDTSDILQPEIQKSVLLCEDGSVHISARGKTVSPSNVSPMLRVIQTITDMDILLTTFSRTIICSGVKILNGTQSVHSKLVYRDNFGDWRHKDCPIISLKKQCSRCQRLRKSIHTANRRLMQQNSKSQRRKLVRCNEPDKENIMTVRKMVRKERAANRRAKERIQRLEKRISNAQMKTRELIEISVRDKCVELKMPETQQLAIQEMIAAAGKKNTKGNRYTENWMMMCMMMHIRSPAHYRFLLKNNVLPLPSPRTIRRYMSIVNAKCGFDCKFFELFGKRMSTKNPMQRHGIILIDEISLRESISVCSTTLTYKGLTDFGENDTKPKTVNEMADHGLVFMFKALADTFEQPIAVFASKGPVKGEELAKLLVKSVVCLENAGASIHAVISDGALTNRRMWMDLGVRVKKDDCKPWFTHPCDGTRKVFVLSDTPHLIKTIRNRLYNNRTLKTKYNGASIEWKHFHDLFDEDTKHPAKLRVCPKITKNHLILNKSTKMRVRLAAQVFSDSMAKGLAFYKKRGVPGLETCEETIEFCQRINDMFDALNRKIPDEGVTPDGPDMEVLKSSLCWLDEWESNFDQGLIDEKEFLTKNTAEGLRVTLQATIDLCIYMREKFQFEYLLTGKLNQDALEQFFGTIRQAAGSNDHPATPTFLQLYKLLSSYSILKPPDYGNCTVTEQKAPNVLVTISDLKNIYKKEKIDKISEIREKLNSLIQKEDWEPEGFYEHDYALAPVVDCLIYYVIGYVCKQLLKYSRCDICINAIKNPISYSSKASSELVNLKTRGGLIHPNQVFFNLIQALESRYAQNCHFSDAYDRTIDDLLCSYKFSFPCLEHADNLLSYAIHYYLRMRMRQFSQQHTNAEHEKKSMAKRKEAKFYKH